MSDTPVWQIKFYGTRGSIPVCEPEYQLFGGNTSCIYINSLQGDKNVVGIFDAGSGIRNLGKDFLSGTIPNTKSIFLAFSHFHWDHIQGFPFFAPAYNTQQEIVIFAPHKYMEVQELKHIFEVQMQEEYFPVQLDEMGAKFKFFTTEEFKSYLHLNKLEDFKTNLHNHPGGAYGYRIEAFGKSIVICTDIEHGKTIDKKVVEFCRNADLLIHEAQYTSTELQTHRGWGHSSYEQAIEVAELAKAKQLIITHHDPDHNDDFLMEVENNCQKRFPSCMLAREGMEIFV